ncbi:mitochondrial 54S ribosomal protein YmL35 [Linderina macrospora]|uniref:Mitochondrial 54S ribosomal protein YmL35 n=1 Tax=Linderina macrospora TaxID=4868 RepID=A0ACC1J1B0_9FUNG|nr:mitochondrial 54S ribosomal protein YmL35 [Linderina macrospora]
MQSVSRLLRTSRVAAAALPRMKPVRFQSTYTKPRTGVNPAYDEALKVIDAYKTKKTAEAEAAAKELNDAQAKSADAAEISALKQKYFDLAVEAEINDSEVLWNVRQGNFDLSKPVFVHLKEKAWHARPLEILMQRLLQMYVLPDLLDPREVGIPSAQLNISLAEEPLEPGSAIEPGMARKQPEIELATFHEDTRLHTLVMVDLDEPHVEQQSFREQFHWVVANLPFSMTQTKAQLSEASELLSYIPPHPARGSPTHRYAFVAFEQADGGKQRIENAEVSRDLVLREFAKQHSLRPVGLSFFRATWDESVDEVYRDVLKLAPPNYGQMPAPRYDVTPDGRQINAYANY